MGQKTSKSENPKIFTIKTVKTGEPIHVSPFEFSGQVTASVYLDGFNYENEDYCLYSVANGEIRGASRGMHFSLTGQWVHTHMIYSNKEAGDTISFWLYDNESEKWHKFEEKLVFKSDMIIENAIHPFILKTSHFHESSDLSLEPSLNVFPNPSGGQATILYSITEDQSVVIQVLDNVGRVVKELDFGKQPEGRHQYQWDTSDIAEGVYVLRIKNLRGIMKQVVLVR